MGSRSTTMLLLLVGAALVASTVSAKDFYDVCDQVKLLGYPCETVTIQTEDGFLLGTNHLAQPSSGKPKKAVVLQHGLIDASSTWVMNAHPYQNLACILYDAGFDIWMPNSRGNHYSMGNIHYPSAASRNSTYWLMIDMDFMAKYDLPAVIDHVLAATNQTTLSWVGHSQGTWQAFTAFGSVRREYAKKVNFFAALAPVTKVAHQTSLLLQILADMKIGDVLKFLGDKEFLNKDWFLRLVAGLCGPIGPICPDALDLIVGWGSPSNMNASQFQTVLRYTPGGTSVNNMIHWAQEVRHKDYRAHNHDADINQMLYGTPFAPYYYVQNMTLGPKTKLYWGGKDALADPTDVAQLLTDLPAGIFTAKEVPAYAHMDFVWGLDAHTLIYQDVLAHLQNATRS